MPTLVKSELDSIVAGVAERGYAVVAQALRPEVVNALRLRASVLAEAGSLVPAAVGHGAGRVERAATRGDRIHWLDDDCEQPCEIEVRAWIEALRVACNRTLMLGLADFEGHYAVYQEGASYARHRDRFRDDDRRVLSLLFYLNDGWRSEDGGALRLYVEGERAIEVMPAGGTAVVFLSADFDHEVLPAARPRWSLAGWLRRRG